MELQNQDNNSMASTSKEPEDCVKTMKFVQELDPLKIPNILEKVFSYLDPGSIKNARQVNPLWNVEGAKSLITKCFIKIPWPCRMQDLDCSKMEEFKEFLSLKSTDRSMIPNITITNLGDFEIWNSLRILGPEVKAVRLNIFDDDAKLVLKLLDALPNLKYLNFQEHWLYNNKILTFLKSLMSKEEKKRTALIIPNLTLQSCYKVKFLEIENFLNSTEILIEELKINFDPCDVNSPFDPKVRIMNKILSTNQSILKRLIVNNCQNFLGLLEFPCMTELTHMDLDFNSVNQASCCKFPPSFRFSEKLPNLQEIRTKFETPNSSFYPAQGFLQHLVENTGPASSVKCVKCFCEFNELDVGFLFKVFPNVEGLQLCVNWRSQLWFDSLWTLGKKLKKLRLYFNDFELHKNFELDSLFTGFAPMTVNFIKEDPNLEPDSLEKLEQLRINPSILNLSELEHLTIDLDFYYGKLHGFLPERMLTVAEKYSIRLLPKKPKITIHVKEGKTGEVTTAVIGALEEVSRLVNFSVIKT